MVEKRFGFANKVGNINTGKLALACNCTNKVHIYQNPACGMFPLQHFLALAVAKKKKKKLGSDVKISYRWLTKPNDRA